MKADINDITNIQYAAKLFREIDETYKPDLDKIDEALVQKWWQEQHFFDTNMKAIDRRAIRVLKPGIWNHNEGPDLCTPKLRLMVNFISVMSKFMSDLQSGTPISIISIPDTPCYCACGPFYDDFNLRTRLQNGKRIPTVELLKWVAVDTGDLYDDTKDTTTDGLCRITGKQLNIEALKWRF